MKNTIKTPGVYINEINSFSNTVVSVATSIPVFIGYTQKANLDGNDFTMKPVKITNMSDFDSYFVNPKLTKQPISYCITKHDEKPKQGQSYKLNGQIYTIEPDPNTVYYLNNSVKLFFENGGQNAYVVSVGPFGKPSNEVNQYQSDLINPNVKLSDLLAGLSASKTIDEVSLCIFPEATLLIQNEYSNLIQETMLQNGETQTFAIIDVKGGLHPDPETWLNDISNFRNGTGNNALMYGAAYYPFLETSMVSINDLNYTNMNGCDPESLLEILAPASNPNNEVSLLLNSISLGDRYTPEQYHQLLLGASPVYNDIVHIIQSKMNALPPSGAIAGIYASTDNTRGVWNAPANISPVGVNTVTINLNDSDQAGLNVDSVSGKSINAIRFFSGKGVLVWGARTLDGNSQDWRYINIRRTATYIEQSCKMALRSYVFAANDSNTWISVKSMLESFLNGLWTQGALAGSKASDAFTVQVGLGSTMTAQDILNGYMIVSVMVALVHPAEFIEITIQQEMQGS